MESIYTLVFAILVLHLSAVPGALATFQPLGVPFQSPVTVAAGLSANVIFSNLTTTRGITFDTEQNLLVVERGFGVTAFTPTTFPTPGWNRTIVIQNTGFTQGIQIDGDKLYISTATTTFVYLYNALNRSIAPNVAPISIVTGIPGDGGASNLEHIVSTPLTNNTRTHDTYSATRTRQLWKIGCSSHR